MRIIAGKYRRRKLKTNPGKTTRPISDQAKEMLFERLQNDVTDKRIADVFAGAGTIGLEALSRGAKSVVLMEKDRKAFRLLLENVRALGVERETLCWCVDVLRTSFAPQRVPEMLPYDTVFFDPPYAMVRDIEPGEALYKSLERLAGERVTVPNALLVLRTPENESLVMPSVWRKDRELKWGSMIFRLFEKAGTVEESGVSVRTEEEHSILPATGRMPDPTQGPSESDIRG